NQHAVSTACTHHDIHPLLWTEFRDCGKGHGDKEEDKDGAKHCFEVLAQRSNTFHFGFWECFSIKQYHINQGWDHGDPHLCLPSETKIGHDIGDDGAEENSAWEPHVEPVQHLVNLVSRIHVGDHGVTSRFGTTVTKTDKQS